MESSLIDVLFRSRKTLLNILNEKGYNITPYEKFGPWEIESMIINDKKNNLKMELQHKENSKKCVVLYRLNRLKQNQSIEKFMLELMDETSEEYISNI